MPIVNGVIIPNTKSVNGVIIPGFMSSKLEEDVQNMEAKPGDIIICGYPKCGNTWTCQIIRLILRKGVPITDIKDSGKVCPFLAVTGFEILDKMPPPRSYHFHYDYQRIPKCSEAKYIYVLRNPKDCLTSLYYFLRTELFGFKGGEFQVLFELFMKGEVMYNDYFDNVLSWYERRNDSNILFLYYEKMKADPVKAIKDIANFMGPEYGALMNEYQVLNDVIKYSTFENMKIYKDEFGKKILTSVDSELETLPSGLAEMFNLCKKASLEGDGIVRKGVVGDWRNLFTDEQSKIMDDMIEKKIKGTDMYDYWKSIECI